LLAALLSGEAGAHGNTPPSLQGVEVPVTPGLLDGDAPIVIDKTAAIQLGKALFWDVNVAVTVWPVRLVIFMPVRTDALKTSYRREIQ